MLYVEGSKASPVPVGQVGLKTIEDVRGYAIARNSPKAVGGGIGRLRGTGIGH